MIDAGPSLRAAEGLSGSAVAAYLLTKGWSARPSRVEGFSILTKRASGSDQLVELVLPVTRGFDEERRRVADALRAVAQLEKQSVGAIADEIVQRDASDDAKSERSADDIALKVLESIDTSEKIDPIEFWEISSKDFFENPNFGGHSLFKLHGNLYRNKLEVLQQSIDEEAPRIKLEEIIQVTRELFEYQLQDVKAEVVAGLEAHRRGLFFHYLGTSHPLMNRIQKEMYLTQLALIIGLYRNVMEVGEAEKLSDKPFEQRNRIVSVVAARYTNFLYRTLQVFKAELIAHDII